MNQCFHHVRGRLRIRNPRLKRNEQLAQSVVAAVRRTPGIRSAEANVLTGSLLVHYDPARIGLPALTSAIELLLPSAPPPSPASPRIQSQIAEKVFWLALEKAVERAAPLIVSALL